MRPNLPAGQSICLAVHSASVIAQYLPKVESVVEGGIAFGCGIRGRDEIIRINAIDVRLVGEARFRDMLK